jgi:hypothetical protein
MVASLRGHNRLLHPGQDLLGLRQRQPQVGDVAQVARLIDLQQVDFASRSVSSPLDQLQHQPHPHSPSRPRPGWSYRSRRHPPNFWTVPASLGIKLAPLPGYSPDLMPVEALWRWLREDVTCHHCHATTDDLTRRGAAFEAQLNQDPCAVADRLWVKDHLNPDEEKLRFSS